MNTHEESLIEYCKIHNIDLKYKDAFKETFGYSIYAFAYHINILKREILKLGKSFFSRSNNDIQKR